MMSVRRLAYPLFGVWVALTVAACVVQAGQGDLVELLLTPALGVLALASVAARFRRARGVVHDTVQPAHVSLWLRSAT